MSTESDVEALAKVLHEAERYYDWPSDRARHVLASDWLATLLADARREGGDERAEKIAQAIAQAARRTEGLAVDAETAALRYAACIAGGAK